MIRIIKIAPLVLVLFFLPILGNAQEVLTGLTCNPVLTQLTQQKAFKTVSTTLDLPFFDDFSTTDVYPDENLWSDQNVYINNTYAKGPVSVGVATFDAVSSDGTHYDNASDQPFLADELTSLPIDLSAADTNTTYLSFYYQPQGNGNAPEVSDSLILEFTGGNDEWTQVWFATGMDFSDFRDTVLGIDEERTVDTNEFKLVILKVDSAVYFTNSFRFRFKNYASLAGDYNNSAAINCDQWNVDYVYLNDGRSAVDSVFKDLTFVKLPGSILKTFQSVPWSHYNAVEKSDLYKSTFYLRNNYSQTAKLSTSEIVFYDKQSGAGIDSVYLTGENVDAYSNYDGISWTYESDPLYELDQDELYLTVEYRFSASDDFTQNNTVTRDFYFTNYYAYDDGSAENAYGINSTEAKVAYQFDSYVADTLKGVAMYFLPTYPEEEGATSFNLYVWDDNDGIPGDTLYVQEGIVPSYSDKLNQFVIYELERSIPVDGIFYIGWVQKSDLRMNVGFDVNTKGYTKLFYWITDSWNTSSAYGSLMMRPLIGSVTLTSNKENAVSEQSLLVYPNPASSIVYLKGIDESEDNNLIIYDALGKMKINMQLSQNQIDISDLPEGLYIISVAADGQKRQSVRMIISR